MGKFRDVAEQILRENGGGTMHIKDITKTAIEKKYVTTKGKTPHASFSSSITEDIKKNKTKSVFERVNSGMYKIKSSKVVKSNEETPSSTINDTKDEENQKNDDSKKEVKKNDETKKDDPNRVVMKKRKALREVKNTESPIKKQKNDSKNETD